MPPIDSSEGWLRYLTAMRPFRAYSTRATRIFVWPECCVRGRDDSADSFTWPSPVRRDAPPSACSRAFGRSRELLAVEAVSQIDLPGSRECQRAERSGHREGNSERSEAARLGDRRLSASGPRRPQP